MAENPKDPTPVTLLVVDDDPSFRNALASSFQRRGYDVRIAASADEALAICQTFTPERVVLDLRMPGGSGLDLLRELKRLDAATAVVVLTGYGSIPTAVEAMRLGAVYYLTKPAEPAQIEAAFEGLSVRETEETSVYTASLDRASWEYLQRVLGECRGNISEAARRLGMHRRTLQRKLQKQPPSR